eukprot:4117823-Pleurochrysis_carterae.AAC.4
MACSSTAACDTWRAYISNPSPPRSSTPHWSPKEVKFVCGIGTIRSRWMAAAVFAMLFSLLKFRCDEIIRLVAPLLLSVFVK